MNMKYILLISLLLIACNRKPKIHFVYQKWIYKDFLNDRPRYFIRTDKSRMLEINERTYKQINIDNYYLLK